MPESPELTNVVRDRYGRAAQRVLSGEGLPTDCCSQTSCCAGSAAASCDPITSNLYVNGESGELPEAAMLASLGCGNPTALAELAPGEVVLDLGSGGGIDVLLSARRVGPAGKAYGLDMTDEMLELARRNQRDAGVTNVEFLKGHIEAIPLPDNSVDVIISNCVINLSADKRTVLAEAFRVLKPGGRFAVSDVVVRGSVPQAVRESMELWVGCIAGALEESEFERLLLDVGFENPTFEPTRFYASADATAFLSQSGLDIEAVAHEIDGKFMSAFVRAKKPSFASTRGAAIVPGELSVLFLCTGNSARSQIAEALLATRGKDRFRVGSAGVHPATRVNPYAVEILREYGIDWTGRVPKTIDEVIDQPWDFVITVCDRAKESCPIFPGHPALAHWGMPDPAEVEGDEHTKRTAFRNTAITLARRIDLLLALPFESLERRARDERVRRIGDAHGGDKA